MPALREWDGVTWVDVGLATLVVTSITTAATLASGTAYLASTTATHTLPAATLNSQVTIKNTGTGVVTVAGSGGALIDGAATAVLATQYASITVVADGTNWNVI